MVSGLVGAPVSKRVFQETLRSPAYPFKGWLTQCSLRLRLRSNWARKYYGSGRKHWLPTIPTWIAIDLGYIRDCEWEGD